MVENRINWIPLDDCPPGTIGGFHLDNGMPEDTEQILCCGSVDLMPEIEDAEMTVCSDCGIKVWRSPRSPKEYKVMCQDCLKQILIEQGALE